MAGNMVMGEAGEMGDCQGCDPVGGDDPVSACDTPCLTPLMATLNSDAALRVPLSEQAFDAAGSGFASRTGTPDSSPPRPIRLSWTGPDSVRHCRARKCDVAGRGVSVRVDPAGRPTLKTK